MSKRDFKLYIEDILECIEKIKNYTKGMSRDSFSNVESIKSQNN